MAKKTTKVTRKTLLKKPDEFLTISNRILNYLTEHLKECKMIGAALVVILIGYLSIHFYLGYVNEKGQNSYNKACLQWDNNAEKVFDQEKIKQAEAMFLDVINEYSFSKAAHLALPQVAHLRFLNNKYDGAIELYSKFSSKVSDDLQYQAIAKVALAACYEAQGQFQKAIDILISILDGPDNLAQEAAMFNLARIYQLSNNDDKASELFNNFIEKYKTSPFIPMAKAYLS